MSRWALIIGPKKSDKTGAALGLRDALERQGISVAGFLQSKRFDAENRLFYDITRLSTGEIRPLAEEAINESGSNDVTFCALRFKESAFDAAKVWLEEDSRSADVIILGDVSKVEIAGQGHFESIQRSLSMSDEKLVVLCVRADQLFYIVEKFGLEDDTSNFLELPAEEEELDDFYREVVKDVESVRANGRTSRNPHSGSA